MLMMQKDYGIINTELMRFGLISSGIGWLTSNKVAMVSAVIVNIWKGFPFVAVMLLAGGLV
jgi:multiple sugar transport system permease protein